MLVFILHVCYKTDFSFAKGWGPQSYFRYTILNTPWTLQVWGEKKKKKKKNKVHFYLFAFLENACFVCNSMGNGPIDGALTSILNP